MNTDRFRVRPGKRVSLEKHDPADSKPFRDRAETASLLAKEVEKIGKLQEKLYADNQWSLLLIFQAPDGAGKDSTIAHVLSTLNPQGAAAKAFKQPSSEELSHDFLWRCYKALPERGKIGIFNRSHYEEVLIVKVQPEILGYQRIPRALVTKKIWQERYEDINAMERHLTRSGTVMRKFYLNVSKAEALPRTDRRSGQELEVRGRRSRQAQAVEAVSRRLRGDVHGDQHRMGALVRDPGGQEVVHPPGGGPDRPRDARRNRSALPGNLDAAARRAAEVEAGAAQRIELNE
jgi:polyphosphate kinase 2 (PPK2 family)